MDKKQAEKIYWALADRWNFSNNYDQNRDDYYEIKCARVWISNRYSELKKTHSFRDADIIACTEWLEGLE